MILYWSLEAAELLPIMVLRVEMWGKKKKSGSLVGGWDLSNASCSLYRKNTVLNIVLCSVRETLQVG